MVRTVVGLSAGTRRAGYMSLGMFIVQFFIELVKPA